MASVVSRTVEQESSYAAAGARAASGTAPVRLQRHVWIGVDVERRDFASVEFTAGDLRDHGCVIGTGRQGRHRYANPLTPKLLDHHLAQMRVGRDAATIEMTATACIIEGSVSVSSNQFIRVSFLL